MQPHVDKVTKWDQLPLGPDSEAGELEDLEVGVWSQVCILYFLWKLKRGVCKVLSMTPVRMKCLREH